MLDGITFVRGEGVGKNGLPDISQGSVLRDGRYTFAWLLRRPLWFSDSVVDMSVIVFSGRPAGALTGEVSLTGTGTGGSTSLSVGWNGAKPAIRPGSWVLDMSNVEVTLPGVPVGRKPDRVAVVWGYPYRVVSVTDTTAGGVVLELQTPIYPLVYPPGTNAAGQTYYITNALLLEYAVEVFNRGSFVQP